MPDPIHDELSEEDKAYLSVQFAALARFYSSDFHQQWRVYERLRNAGVGRMHDWEDRGW